MPTSVSPLGLRVRQLLLLLPVVVLIAVAWWHEPPPLFHTGCVDTTSGINICAASSMARITRGGTSTLEHPRFDLSDNNPQRLRFSVARNETISLQLIVRRDSNDASRELVVRFSDDSPLNPLDASIYQAHYLDVDNAGYNWGPDTRVLPYPASYPDALIPQTHGCGLQRTTLFDAISLAPVKQNQSIWIELYIPTSQPAGTVVQTLELIDGNTSLALPITLDVIDATLPARPSIDAIGEIYRSYRMEGAGEDPSQPQWQAMSQCYQMMAHKHRMVFIERTPDAPVSSVDWENYRQTFGPVLDGSLFSTEAGYRGPGMDTPVNTWRTPWPQDYDVTVEQALSPSQIDAIEALAASWQDVVNSQSWDSTHFFAYVFDEVDGPSDKAESDPERRQYIMRVHQDMQTVQEAIDRNADNVDLVWTSHSDPTIWQSDPETTLEGRVRLWAPNGHAANVDFLQERIAQGERAWFYHSGHPAVGGHSINLPGTDMRSWGVIGARYGIQGQLMWGVNLGSDARPFAEPSYKPDDDRVGNGVMVYPGNQLPKIGFDATPGPLPSMRLKSWHRGLQDAELYYLARQRFPEEADALINALVPRALGDAVAAGDKQPTWPSDVASWIQWRDDLLALLKRAQ